MVKSYELATARVAEHQVRLNEAERDSNISRHEAFIDVDRSTGSRGAEVAVFAEIAGGVVFDAVGGGDFGHGDLADFCIGGGPVKAGGDEDCDA